MKVSKKKQRKDRIRAFWGKKNAEELVRHMIQRAQERHSNG